MMMNSERVLATLRDVAGVEGSWLLGVDNTLQGRDLSALYPDSVLLGLGPRLIQLTEVAAEHLPGRGDDLALCFDSRTIHLRRSGPFILAVLTMPTINVASLRIGMHLLLRQFVSPPPVVAAAPAPRVGVPPSRPASAPRPASAAPVARPTAPPAKRGSSIWGD